LSDKKIIKPFLRWAGGKSWLTKNLSEIVPKNFNNYFEPFLGGGSVFFYLKNSNKIKGEVVLSDLNSNLIQCYSTLRDFPDELISELRKYINEPDVYYLERSKNYDSDCQKAARFIFLNRTSYNGVYRENLKGEYNVPYGFKKYKILFDYDNFLRVSEALQNVQLETLDFGESLSRSNVEDLVFIDPPYTVAHGNNGFVKYNQKIFSWQDQIRLKENVVNLEKAGSFYIVTNAWHKSLIDLYQNVGESSRVERFSLVGGSNAKREKYSEIIITNIHDKANI